MREDSVKYTCKCGKQVLRITEACDAEKELCSKCAPTINVKEDTQIVYKPVRLQRVNDVNEKLELYFKILERTKELYSQDLSANIDRDYLFLEYWHKARKEITGE